MEFALPKTSVNELRSPFYRCRQELTREYLYNTLVALPLQIAVVNLLTLDRVDTRANVPDNKNTAVKIENTTIHVGWDEGYEQPLLEHSAIKDPNQVH